MTQDPNNQMTQMLEALKQIIEFQKATKTGRSSYWQQQASRFYYDSEQDAESGVQHYNYDMEENRMNNNENRPTPNFDAMLSYIEENKDRNTCRHAKRNTCRHAISTRSISS